MGEMREYADLNSPEKMKEEIAMYEERIDAQNESMEQLFENWDPANAKKIEAEVDKMALVRQETEATLEHIEGMLTSEEQRQRMAEYKQLRDAWFETEKEISAATNELAMVGDDESKADELIKKIESLEVERHKRGKAAMRSLGELQKAA